MATGTRHDKIIVGVDGSEASVEALREANRLASALGANVEAWVCWDFPVGHEAYEMMGRDGFSHQASEILQDAMTRAFGPQLPRNVRSRLVLGGARQSLVDASRFASLLVVGRRGHGGFNGLLLGSVSAACVAHAHCPVLVVREPEWDEPILGVLLVAAGVTNLAMPGMPVAEWSQAVLAVVLLLAPWLGGFASMAGAAWSAWIPGAVALVVTALAIKPSTEEYRHHHVMPAP